MIEIRQLTAAEGRDHINGLADVLLDCVAGGASVSFMADVTAEQARQFFRSACDEVEAGRRIVLAAFDGNCVVGTVQVVPATQPNQPHRADVAKLLVRRASRGQGIGQKLMEQVDVVARAAGKALLVLDTVTGDGAERLYARLGWVRVGVIPNYALYPDGRLCDTTVFYKEIR